jgi:hypothetical protein
MPYRFVAAALPYFQQFEHGVRHPLYKFLLRIAFSTLAEIRSACSLRASLIPRVSIALTCAW